MRFPVSATSIEDSTRGVAAPRAFDQQHQQHLVSSDFVGCTAFHDLDLVRGVRRSRDAYEVRTDVEACGPDGRFFEPAKLDEQDKLDESFGLRRFCDD